VASNDPAPNPHATAEEVEAARSDPKLANVLYHDWEADTYDEKWSISYDERCIDYATGRFRAVAGDEDWPYEHAMELGSGTGFFLLNLMQGGVIDLVIGHAVLHHIPDVPAAFREVLRVLKPGGRFVFAGEPTKIGDTYARKLGQLTWWLTTNVTKMPALSAWRRPQSELDESSRAAALEAVVDLHTFDPSDLERVASEAGAANVHAHTEELAAALFGWPVRTFEAAVPQEKLTLGWRLFAYKAWLRLSWLDENVLRKVAPRDLFYNVLITGTKP
jgi:SAM-dependent methyltransferase